MQAGEVIWLLAGVGIGLTIAMLILAGVLVADGRQLRRRAGAAATLQETAQDLPVSMAARPDAAPARRMPLVPDAPPRPPREPRALAPLPAPPPTPVQPAREPIVADAEPAAVVVDEMMSSLAAEIARVQSVEPVKATVDMPVAEPAQAVPEPIAPVPAAPEPEPPPAPQTAAPPEPVIKEVPPAPVAPALPKVPPLPKVTPARKFAPALPPRTPPAKS